MLILAQALPETPAPILTYRQSYVEADGEVYRVRSNIGLNNGEKTFHTINRYGEDRNTPAQLGKSSAGSYGGNSDSSISQNNASVNNKSQFAGNTSTNPNFSDQTRRALKNNPVSYNPVTNEKRLARANEILGTKSTDEVDTYLRNNFFNVNSSKKLK